MTKTVLITGCNGFISYNVIKFLKEKFKVLCVGRSNKADINFYDKEKIKKMIKNSDVIVHLAAITNPFDKNIEEINVNYTKFLVDESKKFNKRFIYLSSQNVLFGKDKYSLTKKRAEDLVKELKNFVILRPTIIYGKKENKYIGKLIKTIKKYPVIPIIGNGKYKIQPIYIEDLTKIILHCVNKKITGVFLVAGSSRITYTELVDLIINKFKLKRLKINIPIFLLKPLAYLFQNLLKNPPITAIQLENIKINQDYDINNIKKVFKINPLTIGKGLSIIIENEKNKR